MTWVPELGLASSGGEANPLCVKAKIQFAICSISRHPPRTRDWMREYHDTKRQKQVAVVISVRPSRATPPSSRSRIMRTRHAVAPKCQVASLTLGCPTHSPLFSCSPTPEQWQLLCRNALEHQQQQAIFPPRHRSAGLPHSPSTANNDIINIAAPNSHPSRIYNSHRKQVPSPLPAKHHQEPHQTPQKKKVCHNRAAILPSPDRKHLYPTHAPTPPCRRRAVPFPSDPTNQPTNQPHFFFSVSPPNTTHEKRSAPQEEGESNRHVCLCVVLACVLAALAKGNHDSREVHINFRSSRRPTTLHHPPPFSLAM
ncbi:hypothetical protein B0T18DRAFT_103945 [Schizothecium vesticola]|uniref:Uncharacterized protein n=1 Tax=Schizothecium vesticola TaxID=314040 RepID=A0AA40K861_9PEZI|nr:hypothetical protein B0T18DRAFT_103945 [Schizothecium vesticola]